MFLILISLLVSVFYFYNLKQNDLISDLKTNLEKEKSLVNEANESKSKFIANTSHEIRNQLQIIKS